MKSCGQGRGGGFGATEWGGCWGMIPLERRPIQWEIKEQFPLYSFLPGRLDAFRHLPAATAICTDFTWWQL